MTKPRYNGILRPDWRDLRKVLFSGMTAVRRNSIQMKRTTANAEHLARCQASPECSCSTIGGTQ